VISSSVLRLHLPCGLFRSGFPTKTLYALLISPSLAMCPIHLILLYLITLMMFAEHTSYETTRFSLYQNASELNY
jgi:hypothetical protein